LNHVSIPVQVHEVRLGSQLTQAGLSRTTVLKHFRAEALQ